MDETSFGLGLEGRGHLKREGGTQTLSKLVGLSCTWTAVNTRTIVAWHRRRLRHVVMTLRLKKRRGANSPEIAADETRRDTKLTSRAKRIYFSVGRLFCLCPFVSWCVLHLSCCTKKGSGDRCYYMLVRCWMIRYSSRGNPCSNREFDFVSCLSCFVGGTCWSYRRRLCAHFVS